MKYPQYLFLTYSSYESHWWAKQIDGEVEPINCSPQDRAEVLQFSLAALHFPSFSSMNASAIFGEDHGADSSLVSWSIPLLLVIFPLILSLCLTKMLCS